MACENCKCVPIDGSPPIIWGPPGPWPTPPIWLPPNDHPDFPPLTIWGPNDPRPNPPIWLPGNGNPVPPLTIWGPPGPWVTPPIWLPPESGLPPVDGPPELPPGVAGPVKQEYMPPANDGTNYFVAKVGAVLPSGGDADPIIGYLVMPIRESDPHPAPVKK